ncbi:hypothetical protein H5410_056905, partial [Solanum commersonii]
GLRPLRNGASESSSIGSIELPHNLLAICPWVSSHPVTLVNVKQPVNVWNSVQAPRENSPLFCDQSGHFLFFIDHLCIPINLPLALDTPPIWFAGYRSGAIIRWCGYGLRTNSVEDLALDPVAWADSNREEWADLEPEA